MVGFTWDMQPVHKYARVSLTVKHGPHCWSFSEMPPTRKYTRVSLAVRPGPIISMPIISMQSYPCCKAWSMLVVLSLEMQPAHKYVRASLTVRHGPHWWVFACDGFLVFAVRHLDLAKEVVGECETLLLCDEQSSA